MKISNNEREWIQNRIIYEVDDSVKENAYWLFLNHFVDPKNESDLKEALKDIDPVSLFESTTNYEEKKKRSGGKRTKK